MLLLSSQNKSLGTRLGNIVGFDKLLSAKAFALTQPGKYRHAYTTKGEFLLTVTQAKKVTLPNLGLAHGGNVSAIKSYNNFTSSDIKYPVTLIFAGLLVNNSTSGILGSAAGGESNYAGSYCYLYGGSSTLVGYGIRNNYGADSNYLLAVPGGTAIGKEIIIVAQSINSSHHRISVNGALGLSTVDVGALNTGPDGFTIGSSSIFVSNSNIHTAFSYIGFGCPVLSDEEMIRLSTSIDIYSQYDSFNAPKYFIPGNVIPVLSDPTLYNVTSTTARPRVTITF